MGWNIIDNSDSQSTLIALRDGILKHGKCKCIYADNGTEFTALKHVFGINFDDMVTIEEAYKASAEGKKLLEAIATYEYSIDILTLILS